MHDDVGLDLQLGSTEEGEEKERYKVLVLARTLFRKILKQLISFVVSSDVRRRCNCCTLFRPFCIMYFNNDET